MTYAVSINKTGTPNVLNWEKININNPKAGEVLIRQTAIGLNYIDIYFRTGLYPLERFPSILGMEAAGIVEAVGGGVRSLQVGDRVTYPMCLGAYTTERVLSADKLIKLPDHITEENAAGIMLKGLTAHYLLFRTYAVQPGDYILVYAAAGGVGSILCQWANAIGAKIIGCVGTEEKASIAKSNGCDFPILYKTDDVAEAVLEITKGEGVSVAYDSVGESTLNSSLNSLKPFGVLASFGNSSGPIKNFDPGILAKKGSLFLTRPTLATHISTPDLLNDGATKLFKMLQTDQLNIHIGQTYKLQDIQKAHSDLEGRKTSGSTILIP